MDLLCVRTFSRALLCPAEARSCARSGSRGVTGDPGRSSELMPSSCFRACLASDSTAAFKVSRELCSRASPASLHATHSNFYFRGCCAQILECASSGLTGVTVDPGRSSKLVASSCFCPCLASGRTAAFRVFRRLCSKEPPARLFPIHNMVSSIVSGIAICDIIVVHVGP